jgi:endonuclease/exonuclease/phosphatase family metal-dependent hydrolase
MVPQGRRLIALVSSAVLACALLDCGSDTPAAPTSSTTTASAGSPSPTPAPTPSPSPAPTPAPRPDPSPPPPPGPPPAAIHVRVVTWNVHHGYTADGRHVNQEQVAFIASLRPDVVALQELAEWDNDMPTIYHQGLESATGKRWTWRYQAELPSLPASKRDGSALGSALGASGQDVLVLDDPSAPTDANRNRAAIRFSIASGGVRVDVATAHLDYLDAADRRSQLDRIQGWLARGVPGRIVAGDFNAEPGDATTWAAWQHEYADAWLASTNPLSHSPGFTMPNRSTTGQPGRIDYQWAVNAQPASVEVVQTDLSDHYALVVDWTVPFPHLVPGAR